MHSGWGQQQRKRSRKCKHELAKLNQEQKENKMGATDMTDRAIVSKDDGINEAYQSAVKQAHWDHGHDSYNGSITTTDGVINKTSRLEDLIKEHGKADGFDRWYEAAFDNTNKWEEVWGARVPEHTMTPEEQEVHKINNTKRYIFAGWGAC